MTQHNDMVEQQRQMQMEEELQSLEIAARKL